MNIQGHVIAGNLLNFTDGKVFTKPFVMRDLLFKYGEYREFTDTEFDTLAELNEAIAEVKEWACTRCADKWVSFIVTNTGVSFSQKVDL